MTIQDALDDIEAEWRDGWGNISEDVAKVLASEVRSLRAQLAEAKAEVERLKASAREQFKEKP